jgi:hypothetical protein
MLDFHYYLNGVLGEKLGGGPTDGSTGVLRIMSGALFVGSSRVRPTLLGQPERLPRMGTTHMKHMSGVRGLTREAYVSFVSGFPLQGVYQFKSPRLSDMSNRLFVPVFT